MADESDVAPTVDVRTGLWINESRARWDDRWRERFAQSDTDGPHSASATSAPLGTRAWLDAHRLGARFAHTPRVLVLQSGDGATALEAVGAGVEVIGVDFSPIATAAARARLNAVRESASTDAADRSRFVLANVYMARHLLPEPDSFDVVVTSRRALESLPVLEPWARIVEWFLAPGAVFVLEDGAVDADAAVESGDHQHPAASVQMALAESGLVPVPSAGEKEQTPAAEHNSDPGEWIFQRRSDATD